MPLLVLGINHKTAPVRIRERVAFAPEGLAKALRDLVDRHGVHEAAILSTCNRTELYCRLDDPIQHRIVDWLEHYHTLQRMALQPYLYQHFGQSAVRHLLRVAAGLDSMVLGEPQVLGQIKFAYQAANRAGTLGTLLHRLFQHTFSVAKQVRTDTHIGASPVSVAFAAVSLAKQIFGNLAKRTALLIGAGETVELVARHLHENRIGKVIVANRTLERAHALAMPYGGYAIALDEIFNHLAEADIVITSTASSTFVLEQSQVRSSLKKRKHQPVFMMDIAVPRDIHPEVGTLEDVYLYTVDDLQEIIQENLQSRREAAKQAEEIVDNQAGRFMDWMRAQDNTDFIKALRRQGEDLREEVYERAERQLRQGKDPEQVLRYLANTLTNKLLHAPCVGLREAGAQGHTDLVNAIKILYRLDNGGQQ